MAVAKDTQKKVDKRLQAAKRATKTVKLTAEPKEITTLFLGDDKEVRLLLMKSEATDLCCPAASGY
jgi:septation ring formation regulator EzrA